MVWYLFLVAYLICGVFVFLAIREKGDKFSDYCKTIPVAIFWPFSIIIAIIFTRKENPDA